MKYIRNFVLLLLLIIAAGCFRKAEAAAQSSITMSELFVSGDYDGARKNAAATDQVVTVSTLQEFQLLRMACVEDSNYLAGISFVQTDDIIASNIKVSYEKSSERILIKQDGEVTASIAQQSQGASVLYQGLTNIPTTWEKLNLTDAVNTSSAQPPLQFCGDYDGRGHRLQGFLGVNDYLLTDGMNSFFFTISEGGCVRNVIAEDCMMMGCGVFAYSVYSGGSIKNCSLNRICIYGETVGSYAAAMSNAIISGCTVTDSTCVLKRDYHGTKDQTDSFGSVGGIAGQIDACLIEDCQVTGTKLYGVDDDYVYVGGIVGRSYGSTENNMVSTIKRCVSDTLIAQSYCAGGIVGMQRVPVEINSCLSIAQMDLFQENSQAGGAIGRIESGNEFTLVNTCSITSGEAYQSGGLIGRIWKVPNDFTMRNCLVLGRAKGTMYGSLSVDVPTNREDNISYCYAPEATGSYFAGASPELYNCAKVTAMQLTGAEQSEPILPSSRYSNYYSLVDLLNACGSQYGYSTWILPDEKYPVPVPYDNLPELKWLEAAWDSMKDDPNSTPTPTDKPDSTAKPVVPTKTPSLPIQTPLQPSPQPTQIPQKTPAPSGPSIKKTWTKLQLQGMKLTVQSSNRVTIRWNKNSAADGIVIYQRIGKGKFCKIGSCDGAKTKFVWKRAKAGKKHTFQIQAYVKQKGKKIYGKKVSKTIKMPYLITPQYRLSVGVNAYDQKYMQIALKRYQGSYIEIYLKKEKGRFAKAGMRTNKISAYKGKIRFTYQKGGATYYCKLRTYRLQKSTKKYSPYSRILKIRT